MNYKLAQLLLTPGKNANSISEIFVAQIDNHKEFLAGRLFILVEIAKNNPQALKLISFIIDTLNRNYYQSEKILLREKIATLKVEHIFEAALAKTNKNFKEYLENAKIKINYADIGITAGIIHEETIYLSGSGKNKAYLIYQDPANSGQALDNASPRAAYKIYDILKQPESKEKSAENKLFSNVISGLMPAQSYFFITNEALPEYLSKNQILETITILPPVSAVEQIKQTLANINSYVSFAGLIIKGANFPQINDKSAPVNQASARDSIVNLSETEDATEELLSPSGIINVRKWLGALTGLFDFNKNGAQSKGMHGLAIKDKIFVKRNNQFLAKNGALKFIKNIFIYLANALFYIFKTLTVKKDFINFVSALKIKSANFLLFLPRAFKKLSLKNKILLSCALVFLLIFIFNLNNENNEKLTAESEEKYNEISALIEQKQDQAEANILFNNDEGAKKLYEEIKALMEQLPQKSDEQLQKYSEFDEKYALFMEKIQRITRWDNLEEMTNFANLTEAASADNIIFSAKNNKIYAGDSSQKSIYILDIASKSATTLTNLEQPFDAFLHPTMLTENEIYFYANSSKLAKVNLADDSLSAISVNFGDISLLDLENYNNNLYALDGKNKQIFRYSFNNGNLGAPSAWIQGELELDKVSDIAIDGNIYLLGDNGKVIKYLRGSQQEFELKPVEPELKNPAKIFTANDSNHIYILEPEQSRVVVFDKNGLFLMQYQNKTLTNIKDFIIDEANKTIYLLDGNIVYKHALTHLN